MIVRIKEAKRGWKNYVLNGTNKKPRDKTKIKIIDGDPTLGEKLSKDSGYFSVILSFKGKIDNEKLETIYQDWKSNFMIGHNENEYLMSSVIHQDTKNSHIHIQVPKVNLENGKRLNFYFDKTDKRRSNLIQKYLENKYELEKTADNMKVIKVNQVLEKRQIEQVKDKEKININLKTKIGRNQSKIDIHTYLIDLHKSGFIADFDTLKEVLKSFKGVEIVNQDIYNDIPYITIEKDKKKLKLEGAFYGEQFFEFNRGDREKQITDNKSITNIQQESSIISKQIKQQLDRENKKRTRFINSRNKQQKRVQVASIFSMANDNIKHNNKFNKHKTIFTDIRPIKPIKEENNDHTRGIITRSRATRERIAKSRKRNGGIYKNHREATAIDNKISKRNDLKVPINFSYTKHWGGLEEWKKERTTTLKDIENIIKNNQYSAATFENEYRMNANVESYDNIAIFDIDNDPQNEYKLSLLDCKTILEKNNIQSIIIPTKSHRIEKDKKGIADRYRVIVPLSNMIILDISNDTETNKKIYKNYMEKISKQCGIYDYCDKAALNDMARYYTKSPINSKTEFIQGTTYFNNFDIYQEATKKTKELEIIEKQKKEKIKIIRDNNNTKHNFNNVNLLKINNNNLLDIDIVDLVEIFDTITEKKGSEMRINGNKYSIYDNSIIYHFESQQGFNNLSYLQKHFEKIGYIETIKKIEQTLKVDLLELNVDRVKEVIQKVKLTAINDNTFQDQIKNYFNCEYCKIDFNNSTLTIADQKMTFNEIDFDRTDIVKNIQQNRANLQNQETKENPEKRKEDRREIDINVKNDNRTADRRGDIENLQDKTISRDRGHRR